MFALILASPGIAQAVPPDFKTQDAATSPQSFAWESPARLRENVIRGTTGTLRINPQGVEFVSTSGTGTHWVFVEIRDLDINRHRLALVGYVNRKWDFPGTRRFDFEFKNEMSPTAAAWLTEKISRPVRNRVPDPDSSAITTIAVRRNEHFGGNNGLLRIRAEGIDYITAQPGQSRSWRWIDLQTLSNPDPYHLFVFGYRDNYAFDLKETLSREVFNHISDEIWLHNESRTGVGTTTLTPQSASERLMEGR